MPVQSNPDAVQQLTSQLDTNLKITDASNYNEALNEVLGSHSPKDVIQQLGSQKVEEVITRSYQDHSESRKHLQDLIVQDLPKSLDVFEELSLQSVYTLADSFSDTESTLPLLVELRKRIHQGEDTHVKYLLSLAFKLLTDFNYTFSQVSFLVKELCDRIKESEVKSIMLLIFTQLDKQYHDQFSKRFLDLMDNLIIEAEADVGNDTLYMMVDILTEIYPVLTSLCSEVLLGAEVVQLFQQRVFERADEDFTKSLLRLFSIACIDETVRVHIAENYTGLLEKALALKSFSVYSVLVLVKTWSFNKLQNVSITSLADILIENYLHNGDEESEEIAACVEGLAYLSLKPTIKKRLRNNPLICNKLIHLVDTNHKNPNSYGVLVILANLSTYPKDYNASGSFEPQSIRDLRAYYELKTPSTGEKEASTETREEVLDFNREFILDKELVSNVKTDYGTLSQGCKQQLIRIIYNVTRDRGCLPECIGQGGTKIVLEYLLNDHDAADLIRILASRALTKMLIFTDPSLIFTKYSPVNAIGPLFDLLPKSPAEHDEVLTTPQDVITTTDSYEALLALTNLASFGASEGDDVCKRIASVDKYWTTVENLMLDDEILLQRSTLELISNLMSHPLPIAVKFFNFDNPRSRKNFGILVKLLQLNDVKSQRAVAAIFANIASTIPFIAQELLTKQELIDTAVDVLGNQMDDADLRQRFIIFFYSLAETIPADNSGKDSLLTGNKKLAQALQRAVAMPDIDPQISEVIPTILSNIKCPAKT